MAGTDGMDAKVVSLTQVLKETRFPALRRMEAYWHELRGSSVVPSRSQVNPREIEDCLEHAFILERIAPGLGRFRLAGMHLNDLMGMEVRGMPLTTFFLPHDRKTVSEALEQVFSGPSIAKLTLTAERGIGRPAIEGELLLMPLKSDFGDVTRVLGGLATQGKLGRAPRRFRVTDVALVPLLGPVSDGAGVPGPTPVRAAPAYPTPVDAEPRRPVPGFAEDGPAPLTERPSASQRPPRAELGKPFLRVVVSNDD